ncbi:MAG: penicillin-binding protein 2 [Rhodospirillales bacterium]|nr:penicillin-binding protein 2 [Rhodospirillales bacterium]
MALRQHSEDPIRGLTRRALVLGGLQLGLFGILGARLYQLQILQQERYSLLAEENRVNMRLLAPPRGRILDRFGTALAINRQNYKVMLVREQIRNLKDTLLRLQQIVSLEDTEIERLSRDLRRTRAFVPVMAAENLTWDQVSRIEVNAPELPGLSIDVGQTRIYPLRESMAHIVGYVGPVSGPELTASADPLLQLPDLRIGKSGVEKTYDKPLRGRAGTLEYEVNAHGRIIRDLARTQGQPGKDLVISIDSRLQRYAHERLAGETAASAVVMDVHNGDLLALASVPTYDPMAFVLGISGAEWNRLIHDPLKPLSNRSTAGLYAPGSTFKTVVALAALEAGVEPDRTVHCPGHYRLGRARFHCWRRWGHDHMDMIDSLSESCDVYFYDVARRIGIERIAAMARKLGLGAPSGLDLAGEQAGVVPTEAWKLEQTGQPWQTGETLISAIGQGFVLTTPLQLTVMTARMANGGKAVHPRLLRGLRDEDAPLHIVRPPEDLGIPRAHLAIVREGLDRAVNDKRGTAYSSRIKKSGWEMAGKTGTSQVRRISMAERARGVIRNEDLPRHRRDHALFVAFAPVAEPRYACAAVVDHGGSGARAAAPIAHDLLLETQRLAPLNRPALPMAAVPDPGRDSRREG